MANKIQKNRQKSLAADIVNSIEAKLGEAGEASKKVKKSIEKSADKLAKKLAKLMRKAEKKAAKPTKKAKKEAVKAQRNAEKAAKNARRALAKQADETAEVTVATITSKPALPAPEIRPAKASVKTPPPRNRQAKTVQPATTSAESFDTQIDNS